MRLYSLFSLVFYKRQLSNQLCFLLSSAFVASKLLMANPPVSCIRYCTVPVALLVLLNDSDLVWIEHPRFLTRGPSGSCTGRIAENLAVSFLTVQVC